MDNFFKQFRHNLESRPEPHFEEQDWQTLSKRLQPNRETPPLSTLWLWCLAPLFLLSLGANYFFYHKMKNTEQKMAVYNSRLDSVLHNTIVFKTDTVYKIQTVFERDTIYKTKVLRETVVSYLPSVFDAAQKINTTNSPLNLKDSINENKLFLYNLEKLKPVSIPFLKLKKQYTEPEIGSLPIVQKQHKTLSQRLAVLRPKDYSIGISAGLAYPFGDGLSQPSGYSLGVNGEAFFSKNISIWGDAQYVQLTYKVDKMSDAIGVPVVPPPSNLFSFNRAVIKQPTLQYVAGLRYHFDHQKRWQPYVGLGFGAVTLLSYEVGYEFKNNSLGTVWDIDQTVKRKGTQLGFLIFDGGLEKRLSKQYRWQFGANYRLNLLSIGVQKHKLLGVKSSILLDF